MTSKFRNLIGANLVSVLKNTTEGKLHNNSARRLAASLKLNNENNRIALSLEKQLIPRFSSRMLQDLNTSFQERKEIREVLNEESSVCFNIEKDSFVKEVLHTTANRPKGYKWNRNCLFNPESKHVIVEFSSPNIAKPFHIGHFRSTIMGSFIANIEESIGNEVTRINYLGDWGTQFGYLLAGMDQFNISIDDLKEDTLNKLLKIYIDANKLGEKDPGFAKMAREKFCQLEDGDQELLEYWKYFRELSVVELKKVYARLNINFDEYSGESFFSKDKSDHIINILKEKHLLKNLDGSSIVELDNGTKVRIIKQDGSSLYITRDIAAAIHRYNEYRFDKMVYVVDNNQAHHLNNLFLILGKMDQDWASSCIHARFGKIQGLSTRKGNIVLLSNIIEEAKQRMQSIQDKTSTTKVEGDEAEYSAEILGLSALIVTDFKQRRVKDYKFSWEMALSNKGDTGVRLQYLHARLHSLLENCEVDLDLEANTQSLHQECAIQLVIHLGLWEQILKDSYEELEPSIIVRYLFKLCNLTNKCFKELTVKGEQIEKARARALLFYCSKKILSEGLCLIGVKPLDRM